MRVRIYLVLEPLKQAGINIFKGVLKYKNIEQLRFLPLANTGGPLYRIEKWIELDKGKQI